MESTIKNSTKVFAIAPLLLLAISKTLYIFHDSSSLSFLWSSYVAEFVFVLHLITQNKKTDWFYSIVLFLIIVGMIGGLIKIMHWPFAGVMILCGLLGTMVMACLFIHNASYSILENRKANWLYLLVFVLICIGCVGSLFNTMHWPFGVVMVYAGLLGILIMASMFLYNSRKASSKNMHYEQFIIGLCLFSQFALTIYIVSYHEAFGLKYVQFIHYPIAALCGAILLKNKYANLGERNLILYLLVYNLFLIIKQTFQLLA